MNRAQKSEVITRMKERADSADIAVVAGFKGLNVKEMTELRVRLRQAGIHCQVVKNTLARLAFDGGRHDVLKDRFEDCCAVAFGFDDPAATAKVLGDFAKTNKKFEVRFGSLEGSFLGKEALKELAELPGRPELLAKLLGTMNAVSTNFVCLFANLQRKFLYALSAIKEQKETAA